MRPSEISKLLDEYGVRPTKSKGQNFLIDERVALREIEYANITSDDIVLEIGPGLGILTRLAMERAGRVIAVERDHGLCEFLRTTLPDLELIEGDALRVEFPPFDRMISNLPYSISSPIIFRILEHNFTSGVIMVQKEFGERMAASAGEEGYCRLSVNTYYRASCELLEVVPRTRFWPEPEVDSCIMRITPRKSPFRVKNERLFLALVDTLFQHRRKKIGTTLRKTGFASRDKIYSLPFIDERVEKLSPEEIADLANALSDETDNSES